MATPVFCCGFECGISAVTAHWLASGASSTFATAIKRNGARAARVNFTGGTSSWFDHTTASSNIFVSRFYIYFTTLPTNSMVLFRIDQSAIGFGFKSSDNSLYTINFANGAAFVFGSTGFTITTDRWYRIDCKINTSSNPHTVDVSVDGIALGQVTRGVVGTSSTVVSIGPTSSENGTSTNIDVYFDDLWLSNTIGDYPYGNGMVHHYTVNGDGTHNIAGTGDFQRGNTGVDILNATTTAFQLVDDIPLPSGAVDEADCWRGVAPANATTDYVEGLFGPASGVPLPKTPPRAVEVILAHHQIATTVGQMTVRLNDNGTVNDIFNTGAAAGVVTYRYATKQYAAGPAGAWVIGGGGNGDFTDLRVRFLAQDANPDQCLDAIMIEAEFAEPQQKIVNINQSVNRSNTY